MLSPDGTLTGRRLALLLKDWTPWPRATTERTNRSVTSETASLMINLPGGTARFRHSGPGIEAASGVRGSTPYIFLQHIKMRISCMWIAARKKIGSRVHKAQTSGYHAPPLREVGWLQVYAHFAQRSNPTLSQKKRKGGAPCRANLLSSLGPGPSDSVARHHRTVLRPLAAPHHPQR